MDSLDFTFTLVSSLTPRNKVAKPQTAHSEKSLKRKPTPRATSSKVSNKLNGLKSKLDKENISLKPPVKDENEVVLIEEPDNETKTDNKKRSSSFDISMRNIALRRNKTREKKNCNPLDDYNSIIQQDWRNSDCKDKTLLTPEVTMDKIIESPDMINDSNESLTKSRAHIIESRISKRKSSRLSELRTSLVSPPSSDDLVVSPTPLQYNQSSPVTRLSKEKSYNGFTTKRVSGESLSTSYGSDSLSMTRRRGTKVILETPESDKSATAGRKRKSSPETSLLSGGKNTSLESNSSLNKDFNKLILGGGTIYEDFSTNDMFLETKREQTILSGETGLQPNKKPRSSNESNLSDQFKIFSSIQTKSRKSSTKVRDSKKEQDFLSDKKCKAKTTNSPLQTKDSFKEPGDKKNVPEEGQKKIKSRSKSSKNKSEEKPTPTTKPGPTQRTGRRSSHNSPIVISSPKLDLMPPTEVIPKFDHISKWLKDTNEKSVVLVSSESSFESPVLVPKPARGRRGRVTLSPRIKKQKTKAQKSFEEEQKLFEELYGTDATKRLGDDVDEVVSLVSSPEDVGLDENVLNNLYTAVRQRQDCDALVTHSEPRRTTRKSSDKKPAPKTEKKKQRMSIYEVFSSSSSEDRFEAFLESVKRGKQNTKKRTSNKRTTMQFIHDSSSESDCSLTFYQNIVSSAVKEEVNKIRSETESSEVNRRRLSFSSSKDGCSESGKSDTKPTVKTTKPTTKPRKKRSPKPKTKKDKDQPVTADVSKNNSNMFSLVTSLNFKDKRKEDIVNARLNGLVIEGDVPSPRSGGKSRTPKSTKKVPEIEDELRKLNINEGDFKVPKSVSALKTPSRPISSKVPSSPSLSFLSSLSENTGGLPCHPEASVYKKEFKKRREELSKKLFALYNREVFESKLPADMLIQWNVRMRSTSGFCYNKRIYRGNDMFRTSRIVLSTKILDRADRLRDTLIHELCHSATWIINGISDGHGPNWKAWADRANRRFPELPRIKRCHDYAISTKYTYKCMTCGYSIGRHSKSLNTERKRCGYCMGKFEAFLTSKLASSAASVASGSDSVKSTRTPTGFALFVKEHYATVKRENNNVPHAQVMKLLSAKFAEEKSRRQNPD